MILPVIPKWLHEQHQKSAQKITLMSLFFLTLRTQMEIFQSSVKQAGILFSPHLIASQSRNPRVLFQIIDSAIKPPLPRFLKVTTATQ